MFLLDTNICIYAINGRHQSLNRRLLTVPPAEIAVSAITVGEMEYGAAKSHWGERTRETTHNFLASLGILPFDETDALLFGRFRAELAAKGTPIGILDLMIAAQAVARNMTVVTHNVREFERVPEIVIEDWVEDIQL